MHLETINIELRIIETGEQIPLELFYVIGERDIDRKRMTDKIREQMENVTKKQPFRVVYMVSNKHYFDEELLQ